MGLSGRFAAATLLFGLVIGLAGPGCAAGCSPAGDILRDPPRNLLLVTIDTLRSDRLGCYGREPSLTPRIDQLASEGALLEQVIVPIPRTTQATASLLTGLTPVNHGVRALFSTLPTRSGVTIAEVLAAEGFETAAFTSNLVLQPGKGFERGFRLYDNPPGRWRRNVAREVVDNALDWISKKREERWFLWVHLLDPHWPYEPPVAFAPEHPGDLSESDAIVLQPDRLREGGHRLLVFTSALSKGGEDLLRGRYDGEVASTDSEIGRLVDGLERADALEHTMILVTADHGESLGDHGYHFAHGEYLYDVTVRVPAILRAPGRVPAGRRLKQLVRIFDLAPTLFELLGVDAPAPMDGISIAPELLGQVEAKGGREIYLESDREFLRPGNPKRFLPGYDGAWRGLRTDRWKIIRIPSPDGDHWEAYDLETDPSELRSLFPDPPPAVLALRDRLAKREEAAVGSEAGPPGTPVSPENESILRSLGYLGGSSSEPPAVEPRDP